MSKILELREKRAKAWEDVYKRQVQDHEED